ncbi:hypothetical protein P171DRAFT_434748 [Karstenula rhodostoma CBS 690.94]|uniref:Uncharacterized protein n=1 Tax=Karstenula rhodostoma CBS 690.94 TaxID=1392251 RepID=A0A9P4PBU9_9PLEO|nr:hypothetical protein P171DRAFT_434748 [Karstenula rhodostoma CBS 690.94]
MLKVAETGSLSVGGSSHTTLPNPHTFHVILASTKVHLSITTTTTTTTIEPNTQCPKHHTTTSPSHRPTHRPIHRSHILTHSDTTSPRIIPSPINA